MAYTGGSIVDYLKSVGKPSDYSSRAQLAKQSGITNYAGTAQQNTQLLGMLRAPSVSPVVPPKEAQKTYQGATPPVPGTPASPVPAAPSAPFQRDYKREQEANKKYGQPKTSRELAQFSKFVYTPDEIGRMSEADKRSLGLLETSQTPSLYSPEVLRAQGFSEEQIKVLEAQGLQANQAQQGLLGTQRPTNTALGVLQEALNAKSNATNQPLGTSELFAKAGLSTTGVGGYAILAQSLGERSREMNDKYNSFQLKVKDVAGGMTDVYNLALDKYKNTKQVYDEQKAGIERQMDRLAKIDAETTQHERQLEIIERQNELNMERDAVQAKAKKDETTSPKIREWEELGGESGTGMTMQQYVMKESSTGLNPQKSTIFNSLVDKYNKSPLVAANDRTIVLKKTAEALKKDPENSALQTAFIYSMIQGLDTYQSAVREGEIGLLKETQGVYEKIVNLPDQIRKGTPLDEAAVDRYLGVAKLLTDSIGEAAQKKLRDFQAQADVNGTDVGGAFRDYTETISSEPKYNSPTAAVEAYVKENPWALDLINEGLEKGDFKTYQDVIDSNLFEGLNGDSVRSSAYLAPTIDRSNMIASTDVPDYLSKFAGNCVKFARQFVPNLPYGLWDKEDKKKAIATAGERDMNNIKPGDAILTGEGKWGHIAVVQAIVGGKLLLKEANYISGKITEGRMIDKNDPLIYGFVPKQKKPANIARVSKNENEGTNPAIEPNLTLTA